MKRIGKLMEEIGFREDAPDSVKAAFLKNLFRAEAQGSSAEASDFNLAKRINKRADSEILQETKMVGEQLSFDFETKTKFG